MKKMTTEQKNTLIKIANTAFCMAKSMQKAGLEAQMKYYAQQGKDAYEKLLRNQSEYLTNQTLTIKLKIAS